MDDFLLRALAAGCGVAAATGPLGCFVLWRRMAYFGDTLAHAALLGVAVGLALGVGLDAGVALVCFSIAALLSVLQEDRRVPGDALLGILSHGSLAFGLLALAAAPERRVDPLALLLGDILAVTSGDLVLIGAASVAVLSLLAVLWRPLLALTLDPDMARVEGVAVPLVRLGFMALIAATVALAMKVVGVLLVTALLIIPAATARRFAATPEAMAVGAALIGALAVLGGLLVSVALDLPAGPSIVAMATLQFAASRIGASS